MEDHLTGGTASIKAPDKPLVIAGAIAGIVPFFLTVSSSSSVTVNGHTTASTYRDVVAIGGGAVAAVCGLVAVLLAVKHKGGAARIGAAVAVLALGGYQLARGFGVFAGGSSSSSSTTTTTIIDDQPVRPPVPKAVCDDGDGCNHLGLTLKDANKPDEALVAWSHGCDLDSGVCCHNSGFYWSDLAAKKDPAKAVPFYEKGCKLGYQGACTNLGFHLLEGNGIAKNAERAVALFQTACDADDAQACKNLAVVLRDAATPAPDRELAAWTHGCKLDATLCSGVADAYYAGKTVKQDLPKAFENFEKACEAGVSAACFMSALMLERGKGQKVDLVRGRARYAKGCELGDLDACNNLGVMTANGRGGPKDKAKAIEIYEKACDGKNEDACKNLKGLKK